jgi:hypothetical protein
MADHDGEEVIISSSGRAVVDGQEISIEEDERTSICPSWLSNSSPALKCGLSTAGLLFVACVSMVIVGLAGQLSNRSSGEESYLDAQYEQAIDTPTTLPTAGITAIPIESEEFMIKFSDAVEQKLLLIGDGSSTDPTSDWAGIEDIIESTIAVTLFEGLPADFALGTIELESIDGNTFGGDTVSFAETNHTIIYSTSVVVDCTVSDCNAATETVQNVIDQSQKDVVQADEQFENVLTTQPTSVDAVDEVDMVDQVDVAAETTVIPINEVDIIETTIDTSAPSAAPTPTPSPSPSYIPTEPLGSTSLDDASCSETTPCGTCLGSCSSDTDCASGLLCFKRTYYEMISGCEGPGRQGQSYCYNPYADGLTKDDMLSTKDMKCGDNGYSCGKCEGQTCTCVSLS